MPERAATAPPSLAYGPGAAGRNPTEPGCIALAMPVRPGAFDRAEPTQHSPA